VRELGSASSVCRTFYNIIHGIVAVPHYGSLALSYWKNNYVQRWLGCASAAAKFANNEAKYWREAYKYNVALSNFTVADSSALSDDGMSTVIIITILQY